MNVNNFPPIVEPIGIIQVKCSTWLTMQPVFRQFCQDNNIRLAPQDTEGSDVVQYILFKESYEHND